MGEARPPTERPLVLIVDDDPGLRAALERHVASLGYAVAAASDGAGGLALAERLAPAVVLSDVKMPVMDGHALLRRLSALGLNSSVVLMSGSGDIDDAIGAIRHGAVDYLRKPWTREDLAASLRRACALSEAFDEMAAVPTGGAEARAKRLARSANAAVDGVTLVEQVTERAARGGAIPPKPAALTNSGMLDATVLRDEFPLRTAALHALGDRIWRFSAARGLAMHAIAAAADAELGLDAARSQRAGMLLDVGALYLLFQIDAALIDAGAPIADVPKMRAAIDARHTLVGGFILEAWGVDVELVDLTHDHHATSLPTSTPPLWCAAAIGGAIAVHLVGFGDPLGDSGLTSDMLARCAYRLGVGDSTLRRVAQSLAPEAGRLWGDS